MALSKTVVETQANKYKGEYSDGLTGLADDLYNTQNKDIEYSVAGLPTVKFVDAGGGEGDGAQKWVVFSVGDQMYRMTGYYSSWDSDEWDGDLEEVAPKQVEVTQYFSV